MSTRWIGVLLLCIAMLLAPPLLHAQIVEKAAGGVATSIMLDELFSKVNDLITKARNDGDYLLARAGLEALNAIEVWRKANSQLLNEAFEKLDEASRKNFARAQQLVDQANTGVANRLETAQQITENANHIIESIVLGDKQTYVLRYVPRIVPPNAADTFIIRIRGVRLDKGDPQLHLSSGLAKRDLIGPLEAQFSIPLSEIRSDAKGLTRHSFKISYTTGKDTWFGRLFGKREEVTREIPLVALPTELGKYEGQITRKFMGKNTNTYTNDVGKFEGTNVDVPKIARPPAGWQWDMSRIDEFKVIQGGGVQGNCSRIDRNASTQDGITVVARVDHLRSSLKYPRGRAGWVNCSLQGIVYQMVPQEDTEDVRGGVIYWTKDESIPLSLGSSPNIRITTFDRRTREVRGVESDKFFDIRQTPDSLIVKPKIPEDLVN